MRKNKSDKKTKNISIDYFQVTWEKYSDGDLIRKMNFDLTPILLQYSKFPPKQRIFYYKGEIVRLQKIEKIEQKKMYDNLKEVEELWQLQFLRLRKDLLPGLATDEGDYNPDYFAEILEKNQSLADSTSCLYDAKLHVIVIQRNRDSILPSGILEYFQNSCNDKEINFGIIPLEKDLNKLNKKNFFRTIVIGMANLKEYEPDVNKYKRIPFLYDIIKRAKITGTNNMTLSLSMGHSPKNENLRPDLIHSVATTLIDDPNVSKLQLHAKDNIDSNVEKVDLFEDRLKDVFIMEYSIDNQITHDRVIIELLESYNNLRPELYDRLRR